MSTETDSFKKMKNYQYAAVQSVQYRRHAAVQICAASMYCYTVFQHPSPLLIPVSCQKCMVLVIRPVLAIFETMVTSIFKYFPSLFPYG